MTFSVGKESLATTEAIYAFDAAAFFGAGSWSEYELVRTAAAGGVLPEDVDVAAAFAGCSPRARRMLEQCAASPSSGLLNRVGFMDALLMWGREGLYGVPLSLRSALAEKARSAGVEVFTAQSAEWLAGFVRAVSRMFPNLVVKFYAARAADLHGRYMKLVPFLAGLVRGSASGPVLSAFERTYAEMNYRSAFMS